MFFRVYFIKLKDVSETIIENYFAMKKANSLSVNKKNNVIICSEQTVLFKW